MPKTDNVIEVQVLVPVEVGENDREKFESAMVRFMFGRDRIRKELNSALKKRGVDLKRLASLSADYDIGGICPSPSAWEFVPTPSLVKWAKAKGVDFTDGGRVMLTFNYDYKKRAKSDGRTLQVNLGLSDTLLGDKKGDNSALGEVTRALFGDCALSSRAQDYLRAFGVDLVEIAAENKKALANGRIPPTSRVSPGVARVLDEFGFNTDQIGAIRVDSIQNYSAGARRLSGMVGDDPWTKTIWSKTTCC